MINDRRLAISVGNSRKSINWQKTDMLWSEFVEKLRIPQRTPEKLEEYLNMPAAQQGSLKDIGGFVGGTLSGPHRKADSVTGRDLITLDLDNIAAGETDNVLRKIDALGIAYAVYSTRSHADWKPRLRVILPLDKTVTADQYEPIARKLASTIGIEMCDPTTFEASRLMYWPGCSCDSLYIFASADKPFISADGILALYADWHDVTTWPQVPGEANKAKTLLAKQQDPTTKNGLIGAFCRTYNIYGAIEKFIPLAYTATDKDDRLTYTGGSTVAGAVVYEGGLFLYSHHATDPCSGQLVNAFDLVRLHLYGDQDSEVKPGIPTNRMPSFLAMKDAALKDAAVMTELNMARAEENAASNVFDKLDGNTAGAAAEPKQDGTQPQAEAKKPEVSWMMQAGLSYDGNGNLRKTRDNIIRILTYNPAYKGKIATDDFAVRGMALGALPWNTSDERRIWSDTDDAGLAWELERNYGIVGKDKIDAALLLVSEANRYNEVKAYLKSLTWDMLPRLDTVLHDYLGAEDNEYTRAVARKSFCAAVARVMTPGCKYDYVPVFVGPQGIGKSTFLATIGKDWYSDSLQSFEGKEAAEMIQGVWINELGEMTSYRKSEANTVKQFLSKGADIYRQAYGRRTGKFPRKCVFFGTCNTYEFLNDLTGNRRFWPVDVGKLPPVKSVWSDLPQEVDQIWAEAVVRWLAEEPLYFDKPEMEQMARAEQDRHREANVKEGVIREFLDKKIPDNYYELPLSSRRTFWGGGMQTDSLLIQRNKVCALEVWCECFGGDVKNMRRADAMEINQILANLDGWERNSSMRRFGYCGRQRGFERVNKNT
jgi:predicted P-loop ATPase|nr:MAG TPA_asm: replicative DNA helicase [Caudoviricetes sp.]